MTLNLLRNGDFELASPTAGWTTDNGTLSIISSGGSEGANYLRLTATASGAANLRSPLIPCVETHKVAWSAAFKQTTVSGTYEQRITWYGATGTILSEATGAAITMTTSFVRHTYGLTVPTGAYFWSARLRRASGGAGVTAGIDGVQMSASHPDLAAPDVTAYAAWTQLPNFVLYQLDDTPLNVMDCSAPYKAMQAAGVNFGFDTIGPICGVSRAAMWTGRPPNVTGVLRNDDAAQIMKDGGWEPKTYAALLRGLGGYYIGMSGKWNNGAVVDGTTGWPDNYCPPGIDDWKMNDDESTNQHGVYKWSIQKDGVKSKQTAVLADVDDYMTTGQEEHALDFLDARALKPFQPFGLIVNLRSTHDRPTGSTDPEDPGGPRHPERFDHRPLRPNRPGTGTWPALDPDYEAEGYLGEISPGVLRTGADLPVPITGEATAWAPAWNTPPARKPAWYPAAVRTPTELLEARERSFEQIRQLQSVGELIVNVEAKIVALSMAATTHRVLWSDNGMRDGWHGLTYGKALHYRHDIELPLVWVGPGVTPGVDYFGDERIFQQIDLLPTFADLAGITLPTMPGRSLEPFFDGSGPATWRITALSNFRTPGESWAGSVGSGDSNGWGGLRSTHKVYTTYYPGTTIPVVGRAECYFLDIDPAEINNIHVFSTPGEAAALNDHFQAYWIADGEDFWQLGLIPLVGPESDSGGGGLTGARGLLVNGEDISTAAYNISVGGPLQTRPGRRSRNEYVPGVNGSIFKARKAWNENQIVFSMWARDCNVDGTIPAAGERAVLVRNHLDFLDRVFDADNVIGGLIPVVYTYEDSTTRACEIEVTNAIDFSEFGARHVARFLVTATIPGAFWTDVDLIEDVVPYTDFGGSSFDGTVRFEATTGATAPCQKYRLIFDGKFPGLRFFDSVSNLSGVEYLGDLDSNEQLDVDMETWTATWTSADGLTVEDHSKFIKRVRGTGPWVTLHAGRTGGTYRINIECNDTPGTEATVTFHGRRNYKGV